GVPDGAELVAAGDSLAGEVVEITADLVHHDVRGGDIEAEAAAVTVGGVELVVCGPAGGPQVAVAFGDNVAPTVDLDRAEEVAGGRHDRGLRPDLVVSRGSGIGSGLGPGVCGWFCRCLRLRCRWRSGADDGYR